MKTTASSLRLIGKYFFPLTLATNLTCSGNVLETNPPNSVDDCQVGTFTPPTPIDPTTPARLYDISAYLWKKLPGEFDTATQKGVAEGTINPERISVLFGNVFNEQRQPLGCATVSILGHPEYGTTQTREGGRFDMVVNGDTTVTVRFERKGYLPVQRKVAARAQDYSVVPDIVLLPMGTAATRVDLTTLSQPALVRGEVSQDASGLRQALLMVHPGTRATLRMADNSTKDAPSLNLHIVEYTRGPNGPDAMPGSLPIQSGYTYAIDIWPDEVLKAQAVSVEFSQPVLSYVENFLNFPVGTVIPAGYYDAQKGEWVGSKNGLVIKVLSIENGLAQLDVAGRGIAARADQLQALSITEEERRQLATVYQAGQSFWRVMLDHLTPWDYNWPYGPPPDAIYPRLVPFAEGASGVCNGDPNLAVPAGSGLSVMCDTMATRVQLPLLGSPFNLVYRSDRAKGYYAASKLVAPVSGSYVPPSLQAIELNVTIAGNKLPLERRDRLNTPDLTNLIISNAKIWDGFDATGRNLNVPWQATVRVSFVYSGYYYPSRDATIEQWGRYPEGVDGTDKQATDTREAIRLWKEWPVTLGFHKPDGLGFGGLGLDQYHEYDPTQRVLYLGSGDEYKIEGQLALYTNRIAGIGTPGYSAGVPGNIATNAAFSSPWGVATSGLGELYIADTDNHYLRSVIAGVVEPHAGGTAGYASNPEPAAGGHLDAPSSVAYGFDGNVYVADAGRNYVRLVKNNGLRIPTLYTIAGNGSDADTTATGHPTSQPVGQPKGIAMFKYTRMGVDRQVMFISDFKNHRIRMVDFPLDPAADPAFKVDDPARWNFSITIAAGTGSAGSSNGPASAATLRSPAGLAVAQKNKWLFIADSGNHCIRRLDISNANPTMWTADTAAGSCGTQGYSANQTAALSARFNSPLAVALSPDEKYLYIADTNNHRIRRLSLLDSTGVPVNNPSMWTVMTVAGTDNPTGASNRCAEPASQQAIDALLSYPSGIAVTQSDIYVADTKNHCIRHMYFNAGIGATQDSLVVLGPSGDRFIFEKGSTTRLRHSKTIDSTGKLKYQFGLDPMSNLLAKVLDGAGGPLLEIVRDKATNLPVYLAGGPGSARTDVTLRGSDHFIEVIENQDYKWEFLYKTPESKRQTDALTFTAKKATPPKPIESGFDYDGLGRLVTVTLPSGRYTLSPQ